MYYFLVSVLVLDALLLGAVILLQAGQGGGLASLGGGTTDLVVGGRQAATLLTKMSWICGGLFMFLALLISLMSPTLSNSSDAVLEQIRKNSEATAPAAPLPLEAAPPAQADSAANPR